MVPRGLVLSCWAHSYLMTSNPRWRHNPFTRVFDVCCGSVLLLYLRQAEENTATNKRNISELEKDRVDTEDRREKLARLQEVGQR